MGEETAPLVQRQEFVDQDKNPLLQLESAVLSNDTTTVLIEQVFVAQAKRF